MIREILSALGVEIKLLFASFCGGIVAVFYNKANSAFAATGLVLTGTFTGHWLGPYAAKLIGMSDAPSAAGFVVGFMAMTVLQIVSERVKKKAAVPPTATDGVKPQ